MSTKFSSKPRHWPFLRFRFFGLFCTGLALLGLVLAAEQTAQEDDEELTPSIVVGTDYSGLYYVNTTFGTPGQEQKLRVDLSQPYTWLVSGALYPECNRLNSGCLTGSLYFPLQSTTSKPDENSGQINLQFFDATAINGTKCQDNMNLTTIEPIKNGSTFAEGNVKWNERRGWMTINDTSFIVANETGTLLQGALGLSGPINVPASDPQSELNFQESFYFLSNVKNSGLIDGESYSLWVNNGTDDNVTMGQYETSESGNLLLGAVDPKYFTGDLVSFDAIPFKDEKSGFLSKGYPILPLSKVSITSSESETVNLTNSNFLQPVFVHSRYLYSYLPLSLIIQVSIQTNAVYVQSMDRWLVACDVGDLGSSLVFEFGSVSINIPTVDFLGATYNMYSNSSLHFTNGKEACYLKMYPSYATSFSVLGQSFLKNAYIVHDVDNQKVAVAQAASPNEVSKSEGRRPAKRIRSNVIPYAKTNNQTYDLTMSNSIASVSTDDLGRFTATVASDGEIFTGRSFYVTSRTTTESNSRSLSTDISSSTTGGKQGTTSAAAAKLQNHFIKHPSSNCDNCWGMSLALALCGLFGFTVLM